MALGVYVAAVYGYLTLRHWGSPEYQAAVHYHQALELLGADHGRKAPKEQLVRAYEHLLEAARRMPQVRTLHDDLESLNHRFVERGWPIPQELKNRAEAVAVLWRRIQDANEPILVVGVRHRGWAPDQLLDGPSQTLKWASIGVVLIFALWSYYRFGAQRLMRERREQQLEETERELKALAGHRPDDTQRRS